MKNTLALIIVSLLALLVTYVNSADQFSMIDRVGILISAAIVFAVQVIVANSTAWVGVPKKIALSLFSAGNVFAANLSFNEALLTEGWWAIVGVFFVVWFILFTFLSFLSDNERLGRSVLGVLGLAVLLIVPVTNLMKLSETKSVTLRAGGDDATSAQNIRLVEFIERPNVYFIAFDSLQPEILTQKYLAIPSAPYHEPLKEFRRFSNFFAERVPSLPALNRLLALDDAYYSEKQAELVEEKIFTGFVPSPLFEIFKHNGYQTNTLYAPTISARTAVPLSISTW